MTGKIDLKKSVDAYRASAGRFSIVDVPELQYLMIDGHGGPAAFTTARDKSRWDWTMMILTPDWIDAAMFDAAVERSRRTGRARSARLLARMHEEFIPANGLRMTGRHHEIYLSDARRVAPERRRTVLRQPVVDRRG